MRSEKNTNWPPSGLFHNSLQHLQYLTIQGPPFAQKKGEKLKKIKLKKRHKSFEKYEKITNIQYL